jgi:hypothetical protein
VTLSAHPTVMNYGSTTTLAGVLSTSAASEKIDILGQRCGDNAAKVFGTATTTAGGNFSFQTQATQTTSYRARYKAPSGPVSSALVRVSIRPIVVLKRNAAHRFSAQVIAAQSFVGKAVLFQRWVQAKHRWNTVKTVFLGVRAAVSTPLAGSTVSTVTFGARLRSGLSVRVVLPSGQAGPCYIAASSRTIRS